MLTITEKYGIFNIIVYCATSLIIMSSRVMYRIYTNSVCPTSLLLIRKRLPNEITTNYVFVINVYI